jgi:hypothetical protein
MLDQPARRPQIRERVQIGGSADRLRPRRRWCDHASGKRSERCDGDQQGVQPDSMRHKSPRASAYSLGRPHNAVAGTWLHPLRKLNADSGCSSSIRHTSCQSSAGTGRTCARSCSGLNPAVPYTRFSAYSRLLRQRLGDVLEQVLIFCSRPWIESVGSLMGSPSVAWSTHAPAAVALWVAGRSRDTWSRGTQHHLSEPEVQQCVSSTDGYSATSSPLPGRPGSPGFPGLRRWPQYAGWKPRSRKSSVERTTAWRRNARR